MYQPTNVIRSAAELKAILGPDVPTQPEKAIDHIDDLCRAWIERSPFVVISSINAAGQMDTAPKGDPPGFVKVLDRHTLALPDRPGNNRGDTFVNVIENPSVSLMFVVPNRSEVVRVSGTAEVVTDPELLEDMAVNGKTPSLALLIRVAEAMFHCGKAVVRARLWQPGEWAPVDGLPSYAQALKRHAASPIELGKLEAAVKRNESDHLY